MECVRWPLGAALPPEVRDTSAWYGSDLVGRTDWIARLSSAELGELETTVHELEDHQSTSLRSRLRTLHFRLSVHTCNCYSKRSLTDAALSSLSRCRSSVRQKAKPQLRFWLLEFIWVTCEYKTLKDTCLVMLGTLGAHAAIHMPAFTRRVNV
jgi:hypothetical protein